MVVYVTVLKDGRVINVIPKVKCKEDCNNNGKPKQGSYRPNPETNRTEECLCECDSAFTGNKCQTLKPVDWEKSPCLDDETCLPLRSNKSTDVSIIISKKLIVNKSPNVLNVQLEVKM